MALVGRLACLLVGQGALTLSLLCSDPSAYTEPYKVCPISAVAPKEDLTSDEERGSSEEEDSASGDPSLTHKVGLPTPGRVPAGCGRQRCEGGERVHSCPSPCGGSCFETAGCRG